MTEDELSEMLENALTVGQLIQELQKHNPEKPVVFAHSSGDYWGNEICDNVQRVEIEDVKWSVYHHSLAPYDDDDSDDSDEPTTEAVIIRR